jgi:hypothetical protein
MMTSSAHRDLCSVRLRLSWRSFHPREYGALRCLMNARRQVDFLCRQMGAPDGVTTAMALSPRGPLR